jgi:hypothetical protein
MSLKRVGLSVFAAIAVVGTSWLSPQSGCLTSPVTVANAVSEGDVTPFIRDLALVLWTALEGLLQYL